jgi:hypothetical protein
LRMRARRVSRRFSAPSRELRIENYQLRSVMIVGLGLKALAS